MSKHGIAVAVDGSAESDAAVRWAASEALLREADVTLVHVVAPVVVTWPVGYLRASYAEWQEENAQNVDRTGAEDLSDRDGRREDARRQGPSATRLCRSGPCRSVP